MHPSVAPAPLKSGISVRKGLLAVIWLGFVVYVIRLAPLDQPETYPIVFRLLTFQLTQVNAYLFAIFWLMGVLPMIYAGLIFFDRGTQKMRIWPYFLASNFTGVLAFTPYLLLRDRTTSFPGQPDQWLRLLDSRKLGIGLSLITAGLLGYALLAGNWQDFVKQWQTVPFVHLITLDFCLMNLFLPLSGLIEDDMARRGMNKAEWGWAIGLLPLIGLLAYLSVRPPLTLSTPFRHSGVPSLE